MWSCGTYFNDPHWRTKECYKRELTDWKRWCEERQQKLDEMAKAFSQQQARIQRMEEALAWYETKVSDCNRQGPEGDAARDALAKDYGRKAKEAKP
jgi:chromosome segregation ATPase